MSYQKICLFRSGALGDVILTLPVLHTLQHTFPQAQIHLIGNPRLLTLAQTNHIEIHDINQAMWASLFVPQAQHAPEITNIFHNAELIISYLPDPDKNLTENLRTLGVPQIITWPPKPTALTHATDHLVGALDALHIPKVKTQPQIWLTKSEHTAISQYQSSTPTLLIHPGSGGKNKCWPPALFAQTADQLIQQTGCRVLISSGPADDQLAQTVANQMTQQAHLLPELPLRHFAALLTTCTAYLGNDSGPSHLAAAMGLPTVALFGPTDPQIWAPRGPSVHIIQSPTPNMASISPQKVITTLTPLLNAS